MTIKTYKTAVRASAFLAVLALSGGAFATAGISESFEEPAVGTAAATVDGKFSGNGVVTNATLPAATGMGYPKEGAHTKALEIAGTVTYLEENNALESAGASMVDFMFKVEPTDELEDPTGEGIKVALAVGTNDVVNETAPIKLWCKTTSGGTAGWVDLASAVPTGSWMRATLVLDYTANKCSVALNGSPALNNGDKWFYFVTSEGNYVSSITMVGSTLVDDFVVAHNASESSLAPAGANGAIAGGSGVTYDYINKYGVTVDQATSSEPLNAASGMSVADKFAAGLNPKSPTKFEMQSMTMTSATTATIKFPGNIENGYTVKATSDKAGTTQIKTATVTPGAANEYGETINSAEFTGLSDSGLIYFHVETK